MSHEMSSDIFGTTVCIRPARKHGRRNCKKQDSTVALNTEWLKRPVVLRAAGSSGDRNLLEVFSHGTPLGVLPAVIGRVSEETRLG